MDQASIQNATQVLRQGGVVAHPTDTCYGLAADIFNEKALRHLYEMKGMASEKPVSILVRSLEEAKRFGEFSPLAMRLAKRFWPGPLTLVVPRTPELPAFLNPGVSEVGIRFIDEPFSVAMLVAFGGPVTTTSANAHGLPSPYCVEEISVKPDAILDGGVLNRAQKPSTLIRVVGDKAEILREGSRAEEYRKEIKKFIA
ncbi:MAG: L-threonylcarbamoyladenylate synthase [Candidatus Gracilibacteria bacterium]